VLLLAGLTKLLESAGFEVAAAAADADQLLAAVERERPDVVIADVRMPPNHTDEGIRAALVIRSQWPDIAILVLSQYVEERYAADLLSANTRGVGYLLKDRVADVAEFLDALRRVAAGGTALDPEVVAQLLVRRGGDPLGELTQRERDVLALMAEGRSNTEIGATLVITESAVSKHINSIFAKLGLYPGDVGHRRVLAVLRYLGERPPSAAPKSLCHDRVSWPRYLAVCPRLARLTTCNAGASMSHLSRTATAVTAVLLLTGVTRCLAPRTRRLPCHIDPDGICGWPGRWRWPADPCWPEARPPWRPPTSPSGRC